MPTPPSNPVAEGRPRGSTAPVREPAASVVPFCAPPPFRRAPLAGALAAVYTAWYRAWEDGAAPSALDEAVDALVAAARTEQVTVTAVVGALSALPARERDRDEGEAWEHVGLHAHARLVTRYYDLG